jgi:hypothetical protein
VADRARIRFASQPLSQCPHCHGGSFLDDPLPRGHDCVTLVRVLFDHEDTVVLRLLRNIRAAMEPGQTLVIAEPMAGEGSQAGNGSRPPISASTFWLWGRAGAARPKRSVALARRPASPVSISARAGRR